MREGRSKGVLDGAADHSRPQDESGDASDESPGNHGKSERVDRCESADDGVSGARSFGCIGIREHVAKGVERVDGPESERRAEQSD